MHGGSSAAEARASRFGWWLVAIVGVRLALQLLLYASGFQSLTADEFARVVQAARWAEDPYWQTHGEWLPLYPLIYGAELSAWWDLVWAPRGLTIAFGIAGIVAMAWLARTVLRSWRLGLVAAALLAVNPGHLWLSSTPLSGAAHAAFVLGALALLMCHLRSNGAATALLAATLLGIACGLRYEAWMIAIPFTALLLHRAARGDVGRGGARAATVIAAILPWTIPVLWFVGHWLATGDPLRFVHAIREYKATWYGGERSYGRYLETFLRLDPFATLLAPVGCVLALRAVRREPTPAAFAFVWSVGLGLFVALHAGQVESTNNYVRYLGPFLFLSYPLVGLALSRGMAAAANVARLAPASGQAARALALVLGLVVVGWQIRGGMAYVPDGNAAGLAVGRRLRELRAAEQVSPPRPVMLELRYWSYLAVHIGANDVDRILYDRPVDLRRRASQSLIFWDWPAARACIARYGIGYVVVRTPELRAMIHRRLGTAEGITVGDWEIVPVPPKVRTDARAVEQATCPLSLPIG